MCYCIGVVRRPPIHLTVILMSRTMLPGEPLSPAQSNAAAKVATIAGAYQVQQWLHETFFDPQDWSELKP